ncbi:hypothetical protein [Nocardia sp. NPDC004722]
MSCEFIVLPIASISESSAAAAYLASREGLSMPRSLGPIVDGLHRWNSEIPVWAARMSVEVVGDGVRVSVPDHAGLRAERWVRELVDGTMFAVHDAHGGSPADTVPRTDVSVDLGGRITNDSVSAAQLRSWIPQLHLIVRTPFLILWRAGDDAFFAQTYRTAPNRYSLECVNVHGEQVETMVEDPRLVADLLWDYVIGRQDRLAQLEWTPVDQ